MATKGYVLQDADNDIRNVSNILASVESINLKTVAQTTLYTVPSQKKVIIQDIILLITDDDTASVGATLRVGKSAAYDEFVDNKTMSGLLNAGAYASLMEQVGSGTMKVMSNGDVIALDVTTGATATTLTATAYVIGYLV